MQRPNKPQAIALASHRNAKLHVNHQDDDDDDDASTFKYLTYRPLSNLPTPPPTYKEAAAVAAARSLSTSPTLGHGEPLQARYLGTLTCSSGMPSPSPKRRVCGAQRAF